MQSCPECASTDLITVEMGNRPEEIVLECESCGHRFTEDEA